MGMRIDGMIQMGMRYPKRGPSPSHKISKKEDKGEFERILRETLDKHK